MKQVRQIFSFFALILSLNSCSTSDFSFSRIPNISQKIRLDGYFYNFQNTNSQDVSVTFFYSNGILYSKNLYFVSSELAANDCLVSQEKSNKTFWGLYKISNTNIIIEQPEPINGYPIHRLDGKILNDSTILFMSYSENGKSKKIPNGSYFYFKHFPIKPDSTNHYIK